MRGGTPIEIDPMGVVTPWGGELLNHYFCCQIRNQRGRFTPRGFLLEEFFENFDFFELFEILIHFWFKTWSKLDLNLV